MKPYNNLYRQDVHQKVFFKICKNENKFIQYWSPKRSDLQIRSQFQPTMASSEPNTSIAIENKCSECDDPIAPGNFCVCGSKACKRSRKNRRDRERKAKKKLADRLAEKKAKEAAQLDQEPESLEEETRVDRRRVKNQTRKETSKKYEESLEHKQETSETVAHEEVIEAADGSKRRVIDRRTTSKAESIKRTRSVEMKTAVESFVAYTVETERTNLQRLAPNSSFWSTRRDDLRKEWFPRMIDQTKTVEECLWEVLGLLRKSRYPGHDLMSLTNLRKADGDGIYSRIVNDIYGKTQCGAPESKAYCIAAYKEWVAVDGKGNYGFPYRIMCTIASNLVSMMSILGKPTCHLVPVDPVTEGRLPYFIDDETDYDLFPIILSIHKDAFALHQVHHPSFKFSLVRMRLGGHLLKFEIEESLMFNIDPTSLDMYLDMRRPIIAKDRHYQLFKDVGDGEMEQRVQVAASAISLGSGTVDNPLGSSSSSYGVPGLLAFKQKCPQFSAVWNQRVGEAINKRRDGGLAQDFAKHMSMGPGPERRAYEDAMFQ